MAYLVKKQENATLRLQNKFNGIELKEKQS